MASKHAAAAAVLAVSSFGLGWLGTAHLMHLPDTQSEGAKRIAASTGPVSSPASTLSAAVVAGETKIEKSVRRAGDNAIAAIATLVPGAAKVLPRASEGVAAYAPETGPALAVEPTASIASPPMPQVWLPPRLSAPKVDLAGLQDIVNFYRKGDLLHGDTLARSRIDPIVRTMLEWLALRGNARVAGLSRIMAFNKAHPDWPAASWLRRKAEEAIYGDKREPAFVLGFFGDAKPLSPLGQLALARALRQIGKTAEAAVLVRGVWRDNDLLSPPVEAAIAREYGELLTAADHKYRADKLMYREAAGAALRAAERAGPGAVALAKARMAAAKSVPAAGHMLDLLPAAIKTDPAYLFARIQFLRHGGHAGEAAALMLTAPRDNEKLVDGDAWWTERRMLARKLLDEGDATTAYRLSAEHSAVSHEARVDAEFHAGWIALRFLNDPANAKVHFALAATAADGPAELARTGYWQGRAAEAAGDAAAAKGFYTDAARFSANYYGQLALAKSGAPETKLREAAVVATGDERNDAVKVTEILYALNDNDLALGLAIEGVQHFKDQSQVAAMGAISSGYHDARGTLIVGKLAAARGFALDDLAFPVFGIPSYQPVPNSAERSVVYAIARQESAFQASVVSSAGAKGLMQMMPATARITASRAGIPFNEAWLTSDPSFNAKLGAAHLGDLLNEQNGSYIMTFAAYNAGAGAVRRWIHSYGDPRSPDVDPVDWVELIPFTETRHYVQTVVENMEIYRLRFGERNAMLIDIDLRHTRS